MRNDNVFLTYNYSLMIECDSLRTENESLRAEVLALKAQLEHYTGDGKYNKGIKNENDN